MVFWLKLTGSLLIFQHLRKNWNNKMKITRKQLKRLIKEESANDGLNESFRSLLQGSLDVAGFVPGWGEIADGINVGISVVAGDMISATLSTISMIPIIGDVIGKTGKLILFGDSLGRNAITSVKDTLTDRNIERITSFLELVDIQTGANMQSVWEDDILPDLRLKLDSAAIANRETNTNVLSTWEDETMAESSSIPVNENMKITTTILKDNNMKNREIRATVQELIKEIKQEKREERVGSSPSESKQLSEARTHVRKAINEMMVGLTPITRIDTQEDANNAERGNTTNAGVDTTAIGFNTFDMHEWASIAGITEGPQRSEEEWEEADEPSWDAPDGIEGTPVGDATLDTSLRSNFPKIYDWSDLEKVARAAGEKVPLPMKEHWQDDGYRSNVVSLHGPDADQSPEFPGMEASAAEGAGDCGCGSAECGCQQGPGPMTGDTGHSDEVGNMDMDFERFLSGLAAEDEAGTTRIGAAAVEGDEHYRDEYAEFDGEPGRKPRG
jgi:hypothetical protein